MEHPLNAARGAVIGVLLGIVLWALILIAAILLWPREADAGTLLTPAKHVLTGDQRSGRWVIFNPETIPQTFEIKPTDLLAHESDRSDVCAYLIWSPQRVTLQPGERQVVRFLFRKIPGGPGRPQQLACRMKFANVPNPVAPNATGEIEARVGVAFQVSMTSAIYLGE